MPADLQRVLGRRADSRPAADSGGAPSGAGRGITLASPAWGRRDRGAGPLHRGFAHRGRPVCPRWPETRPRQPTTSAARKAAVESQNQEAKDANRRNWPGTPQNAENEATEQRNLLRAEWDQARRNLYFAEMTLAGIAAEAPGGLGRVMSCWAVGDRPPAVPTCAGGSGTIFSTASPVKPASRSLGTRAASMPWHTPRMEKAGDRGCRQDRPHLDAEDRSGTLVHPRPHRRSPGVAWSPDGERLATASNDGTARLWNPNIGRDSAGPRAPKPGHRGRLESGRRRGGDSRQRFPGPGVGFRQRRGGHRAAASALSGSWRWRGARTVGGWLWARGTTMSR